MANPTTTIPEASSNFGYEPPPVEDTYAEFRQAEKDSIADIAAEFDAARAPAEEPEVPSEGDPAPEPKAPADPVPEPEDDIDPKMARSIERTVQREQAAREREALADAKEAKAQASLTELRGLQGLKSTQDLMGKVKTGNYSEVVTALGGDPATAIKLMLAEQMGDKAPDDLKAFAKESANDRKIAALEAKIQDQQKTAQAQQYYNGISLGAQEYVKTTVGVAKTMPTLAGLSKVAPDRVHREIMEEITRDAQARSAQDPDGEHMTYEQAARNVEARLSEWKSLLVQNSTTAPTLEKKPSAPPPKPPTRPLKPWEKAKEDIYDHGLKEAMREFHKMEAEAKQRR